MNKSDWPNGQNIGKWAGTDIMVTRFKERVEFTTALRTTILQRAKDKNLSHHFEGPDTGNAVKIYDIEQWNTPESEMINNRALTMFRKVFNKNVAIVDASWGSVYKKGDFVLPHSHVGSIASVLYMLDPGNETEAAGGEFLFADPRLKPCCRQQAGYMTTPSAPEIKAGTMVLFPGQAVHMVTPFLGKNPRITLSWDLKLDQSAKSAVPNFITRPG